MLSKTRPGSIFCPAAIAAHPYDARIELGDDFDEISLSGHYLVNVFIDSRHFVGTCGKHFDAAVCQLVFYLAETECIFGLSSRHFAACAMGGRRETGRGKASLAS